MEAVTTSRARACCLLEGREHVRATKGLVGKGLPAGVALMTIRRAGEAWGEDDCMYFVVDTRRLLERCEEQATVLVVDVSPELAEPRVLVDLTKLTRQIGLVRAALLRGGGGELVPAEEFDVCLLGWLLGFPVSYHTASGRTCLCNQALVVFSVFYEDPRRQQTPVFAFSVPTNVLPAAQPALERFFQQCAARGLNVHQQAVVADQVCL